jgi:hypothetical protein
LEHDGLNTARTPNATNEELTSLQELIATGNMDRLYELAKIAAEQQVDMTDFPAAFAGWSPATAPECIPA